MLVNSCSTSCFVVSPFRLLFHYPNRLCCVAKNWNSLPTAIPEWLVRNLEKQGFQHCNVVQQRAIPIIFSGKDLVLIAPTGSGKTLAFLVPILSLVDFKKPWIQAVILVPTPELGFQIFHWVHSLCSSLPMVYPHYSKEYSVIRFISDGQQVVQQRRWNGKQPVIVISTLEGAQECLSPSCLDKVKYVVLDEFDNYFLRSSWRSKILGLFRVRWKQMIFSSATLPQSQHFLHQCRQHKWTKQDSLEYIHIDETEWKPQLVHYYYILKSESRFQVFIRIWSQQPTRKAIIFIRDDNMLPHIALQLVEEWKKQNNHRNISLLWLSSKDSLKRRQRVITAFGNGKVDGLLMSSNSQWIRGLDIPDLTQVYNLEWTDNAEEYVHRAGRSARWLKKGWILSFVQEEEWFALKRVSNQLHTTFVQWPD